MGNYFLRTKKEKGTASVYLRVQKRNPKLNILVCSKVSVDIQQWDKVTQDVAKWNDYCKTQDGRKVKETLDSISSAIDNLISQGIYDKARIDEVVEDVVFREERERQRIQEEEERQEQERLRLIKEQEEEARKADVILFLENFLEGIKNGRIKNGAEKQLSWHPKTFYPNISFYMERYKQGFGRPFRFFHGEKRLYGNIY